MCFMNENTLEKNLKKSNEKWIGNTEIKIRIKILI